MGCLLRSGLKGTSFPRIQSYRLTHESIAFTNGTNSLKKL
jgi:hypothetical protein